MTAIGRITTTRIESGTRLVVERGPGGRLLPTSRKRGSVTVTVTSKDVVTVEGGRQRRYVIHTANGQTLPVPGAQTFKLADDQDGDTAPDVEAPASVPAAPTCSDPVAHVPGVLGCNTDVTNCDGVPAGLEMTGRLITGDESPAATGVETVARAIVSALSVRHAVASARYCSADPYGRGGVRVGSTVSALVDEHRVIVALYYGRTGPLSEESTFYAVLVDGAVIAGALPGARTPHDVGALVAREFRCWLMDRRAVSAPAVITIAVGTCPTVDPIDQGPAGGALAVAADEAWTREGGAPAHDPDDAIPAAEVPVTAPDCRAVTITHNAEDGTTVDGLSFEGGKTAGIGKECATVGYGALYWRYSRHVGMGGGWYDRGTRDKRHNPERVGRLRERLEKCGYRVTVEIDDTLRPTAEVAASGPSPIPSMTPVVDLVAITRREARARWDAGGPVAVGTVAPDADGRSRGPAMMPNLWRTTFATFGLLCAAALGHGGLSVLYYSRPADQNTEADTTTTTTEETTMTDPTSYRAGKVNVGDVVRVAALHGTDFERIEDVTVTAETVTHLGCGCWRIGATRPGPADGKASNRVDLLTGCGFHPSHLLPSSIPADVLATAGELGARAYADGLTPAAPAMDPDVMAMVKDLPVGGGGADIFRAFLAGHAAAAEREAEHAAYAANLSDQNAEAARAIADRNPAAEECAAITAAGAVSAANNLAARTAEAEVARAAVFSVQITTTVECDYHGTVTVEGDSDSPEGRDALSAHRNCRPGAPWGDPAWNDPTEAPGAAVLAWTLWGTHPDHADGQPHEIVSGTLDECKTARTERAGAGGWDTLCIREQGAPHGMSPIAYLSADGHAAPVEELASGDQDDAQPGDDTAAEPIYTAAIEAYAPTLKSDDDAELTITHDHVSGTVMDGGCKGDGTLEIVAVYRFQWRRYAGVHIPGSRDRFADLVSIDKAAEALRAAGHTVAVEIDDVWRPAGVREEHRAERVTARVERLTARATARFAESNARELAARNIADGMPFGEPIKVGHHSEARHRRAFDRIDSNTRAAIATGDYARHLAGRAAGAESNEDAKRGPRAIMRRIEALEVEARSWARELANEGTGDGRRRRATLEAEKIAEDVRHQRAKLGDMAASGAFVAWAGEHFTAGDWANVGGRWCEVARVNKKGVSVYALYDWYTRQDKPQPVKWDQIHGRRRDGMQWDAPNAEPYSVQEAQQAARWRTLARDAARSHSTSGVSGDELHRRIHVEFAERITLGLAPDAAYAEVTAYGTPGTKEGRRARALACLAVFERLEAGEKVPDVAATVQPIGDTVPTWTMPTGDTVDILPKDLAAGDVIAGLYDRMWGGGNTLLRSLVGPLAGPPVFEDRRESGEYYTVRLTTGDERTLKSHQWMAVHRAAPLDDEPAEPAADAGQLPTYGLDVDGVRVAVVTRVDLTAPAETVAEVPAGVQAGDRVDVGWAGGLVDVTSVEGGRLVGEFGVPDEIVRVPLEQVRTIVRDGVTAYPARDVTVVNDARGNLEVHRPGCRDIAGTVRGGGSSWDVSTQDVRGLVVEAYAEHEGFAADASNWRDFAGDLTVMPCLPGLPDEAPAGRVLADAPPTLTEWADVAALIGDQSAAF